MEIVNQIKQEDIINSIKIVRIGKDALDWNANDHFNNFKSKKERELEDLISKSKSS